MYIQEIILEGFKSYATRTVISGWDPEFNAITGLNGSGKSNILDAICFVLGIENLRQVRATTLQDLVYKRGQAGITKASVTIVFNNEDAAQSPVGYAEHKQITVTRQIIVGGKNKYLVNGHNATSKVVENIFQSVQLNINNPHFLIMQGQITKVLNMKPPEILAMLEETAGTRMFEDRKLKALQTMERKERKVEEIEGLLKDVIEPKLEALRKEKSEYVEFKRGEADIERLVRFLAAFDYWRAGQERETGEARLSETMSDLAALEEEIKETGAELEKVNDQIMVAEKKREKELKGSYRLKELESELREAEHELIRLQTQADLAQSTLDEERQRAEDLEREIEADAAALRKGEEAAEKDRALRADHDTAFQTLKAKVEADEELLRSLSTGVSSGAGKASGYEQLVASAQDRIAAAEGARQEAQLRLTAVQESLAEIQAEANKAKKTSSGGGAAKVEMLKSEIAALEAEEGPLAASVNNERERVLETEARRLESGTVQALRDRQEQLRAAVASVRFQYSDPSRDFDRSAVKGVVAELVRLPAENRKYAQALEVAAGGRLYNVVVRDEQTAAALLEKGQLKRRVTIIPLDRIVARPVSEAQQRTAVQLTGGRATLGLQLVLPAGADVQEAIKYVFGGAFVCEDKEAANIVAFDGKLGCRAVTVEGDVYEPSGTLSGGSAPHGGSLLARFADLTQVQAELDAKEAELVSLTRELEALRAARRKHADASQRLEQKRHDLAMATRRLALDPAGRALQQFEALQAEQKTLEASIEASTNGLKEAQAELERVRREMSEFASDRSGKLAALEKNLANGRKALGKARKEYEAAEAGWAKQQAALAATAQRVADSRDRGSSARELVTRLAEEGAALRSAQMEQQTRTVGIRIRLDAQLAHLKRFDEHLQALQAHRQHLQNSAEQAQTERGKLQAQLSAHRDAIAKSHRSLQALLSAHPWIRDAAPSFGQPNGAFDFASEGPKGIEVSRARLAQLQEQHSRLRRSINFNVMDMIDRIEAKEAALKQMLATVKKDRVTIESTIDKLNSFKLDALSKTFDKVNQDFGLILGDLLPTAFARLQPPDGQEGFGEGLEIRVRLGGVWKAGLAELSGGQRSVIALALILALLQFKPAPMYILDEVDAALDLSHTENIGRLFQTRFKGSQFIVVSLKEGMFSNANVLFKTRFRDGISSVERTQNASSSSGSVKATKTKRPAAHITLPKATKLAVNH